MKHGRARRLDSMDFLNVSPGLGASGRAGPEAPVRPALAAWFSHPDDIGMMGIGRDTRPGKRYNILRTGKIHHAI